MIPLTAFLIAGHVTSSVAIENVSVGLVHTVKVLIVQKLGSSISTNLTD